MSAATIRYPAYYSDYLALKEQRKSDGPAWLGDLCSAAWERFNELGFPTARRGNERWKYTSVAPLARAEFAYPFPPETIPYSDVDVEPPSIFPDKVDSSVRFIRIKFFEGHASLEAGYEEGSRSWPEKYSREVGATFSYLADALDNDLDSVGRYLGSIVPEDDPFVALNTAFLNDGVYIRIPDDYAEKIIVEIIYCSLGVGANVVTHPRNLIVAGRNTNITVFEGYTCLSQRKVKADGPRYFTNAVTEIVVGEGAQVQHYRLLDESRNAFHVGTTRVTLAKDSSYNAGSFALGAALARQDLSVLLDGTGAYCSVNGLYLTDDTQHVDNLISIDHAKPHGTSRLFYKGILGGRSRAVFGGTVLVREDAQKTDAQQTDKNLILSDRAEVDSKPSLLIYADDVKCGHGATAGHIDDDTLFYMRSRGIDPETASQILIHAFASEIIESVPDEPVRDYLDDLFLNIIPGKTIPITGASPLVGGA